MSEIKLGLGNPPLPIYLYVKNEEMGGEQYVWYKYLINQKEKIPVYQRALTGFISEIRLTEKDYRGQDNLKLDIVISADELYVVRSGINTNFAKSFLLAASVVEDFSKPLIIVANPGNETVVFCSLYDAATKTKIRRDWDANADWAFLIQSIQSRLSSSPKFELEEEFSHIAPPSPNSKSAAVHPQDLRIKQVRTLMDYPIELVKEWLHFQDVKFPSQLPQVKVDELVKSICLAWASDKADPYRAESSYQQQVLGASGVDEITAIQAWMNYVQEQLVAVSAG